ncbi:MAG: DNA polymerase III subunit beta [Gallionellaceae bacterium CG1_02_56_997]|nr:MAG: DNA polymerase III subunit beta [Gallionellaceae bacterium CG1_02_56_997]PIY00586.1 MAG: DNA polymerase III subunit beta [Hydrogenophilales bacterium CG_4_10_14_3_um_filter_58_23]
MGGEQMGAKLQLSQANDVQLRELLTHFPQITLAVLFGSVATRSRREDSDLDIAVAAKQVLTAQERITLVGAWAERIGRPVDLIDLYGVSEPLLGQIVRHGRRILGSDTLCGYLIARHLFEQADFMPYRTRILAERRLAWIGK